MCHFDLCVRLVQQGKLAKAVWLCVCLSFGGLVGVYLVTQGPSVYSPLGVIVGLATGIVAGYILFLILMNQDQE